MVLTWDVSKNTVLPWYHVWNHLNTVVLWYCGIKHYHFTYPGTPRHFKQYHVFFKVYHVFLASLGKKCHRIFLYTIVLSDYHIYMPWYLLQRMSWYYHCKYLIKMVNHVVKTVIQILIILLFMCTLFILNIYINKNIIKCLKLTVISNYIYIYIYI